MKTCVGVILLLVTVAAGLPTVQEETKDNTLYDTMTKTMDGVVRDLKKDCELNSDTITCIKFKVLELIDQAVRQDTLKVSDSVKLVKNDAAPAEEASGRGFVDQLENYVQTHDMLVQVPFTDTTLAISPRNIENNEISMALRYPEEEEDNVVEGKSRRRKKKKNRQLMKILVPIVVVLLFKAFTLMPLFIGALGMKAWNALQLSIFSFLISFTLTIVNLFKKVKEEKTTAIAAKIPWEGPYNHYAAAKNFFEQAYVEPAQEINAQQMAYNGYKE